MTGAKFQYDENGTTFYFFLLSFEALVVVPCTYYFYPRNSKSENEKDKTVCQCHGCCLKNKRLQSKEPLRKAKERFIKFLLIIGWITLCLTAYHVAHLQHDFVVYDPFEILQINQDASMSEVKKAYRKLSLMHHPDKGGDESKFMMIAKAYAALTVEESRKNWELYGNPDGPGPTTFGIALPSYIVHKDNTVLVLGLYSLVFMVALPVGVTIWWQRSKFASEDNILLDTSQLFYYFIYKTPHMIFKRVVMIISASLEFEKSHNSQIVERPSDNVEVPQLIKELSNYHCQLGEKNKERPLCFGYSIKARTLIFAHLTRLKLSQSLESDRDVILNKAPKLIEEFVSCVSQLTLLALAGRISRMPNLTTMESAMKLSQCLVQALWVNKSPLLQLPHINEECLRHFTTRRRRIRSIYDLSVMKNEDRRDLLRNLSNQQYTDVMNVISKMPIIEMQIQTEVLDDDENFIITAGAIVTCTVNLTRQNLCDVIKENGDVEGDITTDAAVCKDDNSEAFIANGDVKERKAPHKVWEKPKKRKTGGKKPKKKVPKASSKKTANSSKSLPNDAISEKVDEKKKETLHSAQEASPVNSESDDSSLSEAEDNENIKGKSEMCADDADEDSEWEKFQQKIIKKKKERVLETKSKKSHIVHCPYFPSEKHEAWWLYVVDKHRHSLITNPYFVTNLVFKEEVELKFSAPQNPGLYTYSIVVKSDSYIDFDVVKSIHLDVKEAKEVDITKVQWDVSEEEEEKDEEESAVEDSDLASDEVDDE